ncbi:MAG: VacJ family lipoprotein [Azonexus sp.]|jgi:phospholipid-binding lipoprotein MlaA|uniref:MlaA family lipoprotein n=1 Tax=Azonexus sp. TaxID=1872668 RepID=UPI00281C0499|nr:VacJ family lipoprotein [Azonexus sp.]MDR0775699.1 VacJ family lipoprotein [Azonexus sp.]
MGMDTSISRSLRAALLAASLLAVAGSAVAEAESRPQERNPKDPFESFNRAMFAVNEAIDTVAARPAAQAYDTVTPLPVKAAFGNFFANVGDLWVGVNSALQGKGGDAGNDLARLLINSTIGIFGLFDVASELGLERHDEDFGQTLAVWGVGDGGYVFLPVLGPRTVRDAAAWGVDYAADPVRSVDPVRVRNSATVVRFVDIRASLLPYDKVINEAALDRYSYIRDAYLQRRRNQIFDGRPPRLDDDDY